MKQTTLLFLVLLYKFSAAQNFVPNPGFEDTVGCPPDQNYMFLATGWDRYTGTPDFFNACSDTFAGIPKNHFGYQHARTGNGYGGFAAYYSPSDYREIPGIELTQPLIVGNTYLIEFYVCRAGETTFVHSTAGPIVQYSGFNLACNKIGARFTNYKPTSPNPFTFFTGAHVFSNAIITDSVNWTYISGTFTADSSYKHITFGNFFPSQMTNYVQLHPLGVTAYYYIDDISVTFATNIEQLNAANVLVYPSIFHEQLNCKTETSSTVEFILFDIFSRKSVQQEFSKFISLNTEHLENGIYIYQIRSKGTVIKTGKLIKE